MDIEHVWKHLSQRGYRKTRQRRLVVEAVSAGGCLQSAEEILQRCREQDANISFPTIYRTLEVLAEAGLVRRVNLGQGCTWFEPVRNSQGHHHHLVCTACGARQPIAACPRQLIEQEARRNRFKVLEHHFEIIGLCGACAAKD